MRNRWGNITATIDVNWTFTGAPGTSALVTNIGNNTVAKLDFTIPAGVNGTPGDPGPQGVNGTPGLPGTPGAAATVDVNATFTGLPGTYASVVNIGSTSAALFDFTVPQGIMNQTPNMTANMTAGVMGATGGFSIFYTFSTTTAAPPADKTVRYNSGTPASVTLVYIDETDRFGIDNIAFLNSISIGSSLMFANETTRDLYHIYNVTSITDSGDYFTIGTDSFSGNPSAFSNNMPIFMSVAKKGAIGASAPEDLSQDANILFQADSHIASNKTSILTATISNTSATLRSADDHILSNLSAVNQWIALNKSQILSTTQTNITSAQAAALRAADDHIASNSSSGISYATLLEADSHIASNKTAILSAELTNNTAAQAAALRAADDHIESNTSRILTAVNANETLLQSIANDSAWDKGYTIPVMFLTQSWTNSTTNYFGSIPAVTTTTAGQRRMYITKAGNVTGAEIWVQSGTGGSDQPWTMDISKNGDLGNTTTLGNVTKVGTVLSRRWSANTTFKLRVERGDYIEIKTQFNLFPVKPATSIGGGYIYIE